MRALEALWWEGAYSGAMTGPRTGYWRCFDCGRVVELPYPPLSMTEERFWGASRDGSMLWRVWIDLLGGSLG